MKCTCIYNASFWVLDAALLQGSQVMTLGLYILKHKGHCHPVGTLAFGLDCLISVGDDSVNNKSPFLSIGITISAPVLFGSSGAMKGTGSDEGLFITVSLSSQVHGMGEELPVQTPEIYPPHLLQ